MRLYAYLTAPGARRPPHTLPLCKATEVSLLPDPACVPPHVLTYLGMGMKFIDDTFGEHAQTALRSVARLRRQLLTVVFSKTKRELLGSLDVLQVMLGIPLEFQKSTASYVQ